MINNTILSANIIQSDQDLSFRPSQLKDFTGQKKIKDNLSVFIQAARSRKESLDHVLLYGPPGLGKTTLAQIISKEMNVNIKSTSGPVLSKAADIAAILTNLEENDILFIDEIHRLNVSIEEVLYSAMEDFVLDIMIGEGPSARSVRINLPKFTLIGATTRLGLLTNPLRDRFGIPLRLNFYELDDLKSILIRAAKLLGNKITEDGAYEIAKRSRGTPRIALRLLRRICDFALVYGNSDINIKIADEALNNLEVDKVGLDENDYRYLRFIAEHYQGGPVGIDTIAAALSEHRDSLEETIEPYLMQIGMLQRTQRGRLLTMYAFKYLGIDNLPQELNQSQLKFTKY